MVCHFFLRRPCVFPFSFCLCCEENTSELALWPLSESCSVVSNSLRPHGLYCPWNSPGQNTGVGSRSLFQGIFSTQGSNPGLPHLFNLHIYGLSGPSKAVMTGTVHRGWPCFTYLLSSSVTTGLIQPYSLAGSRQLTDV